MTQNLLLLAFSLLPLSLNAQFSKKTTPIHEQYAQLYEDYEAKLGKGSAIFHGPEYIPTNPSILGDPFFLKRKPAYGSVVYQGYYYDSLLLAYDVIQDNLILSYNNLGQFFTVVLNGDKVDSFGLHEHVFHHIKDATPGLNNSGLYDVLYDGTSKILVKRRKSTRPANTKGYLFEYVNADRYFVLKNDAYHSVTSKGGIYRLFNENKKAIKREMRKVSYTYKSQTDRYLQRVCMLNDRISE